MNRELQALVADGDGVVTRARAEVVVTRWVLRHAQRSAHLQLVLPGVFLDGRLVADEVAFRNAVLAWAGERGALSHTTALSIWGLYDAPDPEPVHLTVPHGVGLRSRSGVVVHHRTGFSADPPHARRRAGQLVTPIERSLVDSWSLLPLAERRIPLIQAVNDRMTTADRVREMLADAPKLADRAHLVHVLDLLAAGCRSPLEIFGHEHVFTGAGMPTVRRQVRVRVNSLTIDMDVYVEQEKVDFELDGAAWHSDQRQRERRPTPRRRTRHLGHTRRT